LALSPDDIIDAPAMEMSTNVWHHKAVRREIPRFAQRNFWLSIANKRTRQVCLPACSDKITRGD